jgi:cohesin domain-containing protein/PEP-CTERM motif-containing protein
MKKLFLSAAVALFMIVLFSPTRTCADAILSVQTPSTVSQGSTFAVGVNISGVTNLYDFQFDLSFNPAVLHATNVLEGTFLSGGGSTFFIPGTIDNTTGNVTFDVDTLLGPVPGVSGNGTLALFDFTALASGTSGFTISNMLLQDSTGAILNSTTTGGSVAVQGTTAVPEPSGLILLGAGLLALAGLTLKKNIQ